MGLASYAVKRVLLLVPVFLGITAVVFLLLKLVPGSPVVTLLPPTARTPARIAQLKQELGLNQPIYIQYLKWLWNVLHLDLGRSYATRQPVLEMILNHVWPTIQLTAVAFIIALLIAIPIGVLSGVYKNSWIDHTGRIVAFGGISVPPFWLGIMVILVFALYFENWYGIQVIPTGGYVPLSAGLASWFRHIIAPALVLGLGFSALTTRLTRASMIEALNQDYIRTAHAKGITNLVVVMVHGFRNALIPVLTVMGMQLGFLLNGAVVVEQVFQWPGIGRLLYTAVLQRDMPLIQGIVLFIAAVFVLANLAVDLLYALLDPRIKYD